MIKRKTTLSTSALVMSSILLSLSSGPGLAEEPSWYQAEVIIFKRLSHNQTELAIDPRRLSLDYPEPQAFIVDRAFMLDEAQRLDINSSTAAAPPKQSKTSDSYSQFGSQGDANTQVSLQKKAGGDFYLQLNKEQHLLSNNAKALSLSRNQRVLFHKSWNQQLSGKSAAPAIIINGGQVYDEHTELEGYIRISKARYLHVDANLWLSRFSPSLAGEIGNWPSLPDVPGHHRTVKQANVGADSNFHYQGGNGEQDIAIQNSDLNQNTRPDPEQLQQDLMAHDLAQLQNQDLTGGYHVEEIQNIRQSRRMRSRELHYIDHPAFGLIVQLIPIEAPKWPYNNQIKQLIEKVAIKESSQAKSSASIDSK